VYTRRGIYLFAIYAEPLRSISPANAGARQCGMPPTFIVGANRYIPRTLEPLSVLDAQSRRRSRLGKSRARILPTNPVARMRTGAIVLSRRLDLFHDHHGRKAPANAREIGSANLDFRLLHSGTLLLGIAYPSIPAQGRGLPPSRYILKLKSNGSSLSGRINPGAGKC